MALLVPLLYHRPAFMQVAVDPPDSKRIAGVIAQGNGTSRIKDTSRSGPSGRVGQIDAYDGSYYPQGSPKHGHPFRQQKSGDGDDR